jgi:pSer/pThr/pTyr-binding forkhead associated (FHA) protein
VNQVEEWSRVRAAATRPQFEAMYPWAFLVSTLRRGTGDYTPLAKTIEFRTMTDDRLTRSRPPSLTPSGTPSITPHAALMGGSDERVIVVLTKAAGNPFPERISIGRAPNCDVVIRDSSISKLHGHFRDVRVDSAVFTDAKSSNGTRVDGDPVEAGVAIEILRTAADVYDWL